MNKTWKIFFFVILTMFAAHNCFAQEVTVKPDSSQMKQDKQESGKKKQNRNGQNGDGTGSIKQVNGARPDMSKARGARPPDIVRPSGSGIPRGMGKPGGAGRRGR